MEGGVVVVRFLFWLIQRKLSSSASNMNFGGFYIHLVLVIKLCFNSCPSNKSLQYMDSLKKFIVITIGKTCLKLTENSHAL